MLWYCYIYDTASDLRVVWLWCYCYDTAILLLSFCFRFKSGQSNNIPISRGTSNQTPNLGQISQDHQQFHSHGNPLYTGNLSGAASSMGHPGPVQGVSQQGLNRPQQDSFLPRESNIQQQETNLRSQENYPLPQGNLTRPQEIYPQPQETRETNTAAMIGNQNVTSSQQVRNSYSDLFYTGICVSRGKNDWQIYLIL